MNTLSYVYIPNIFKNMLSSNDWNDIQIALLDKVFTDEG